MDLVAIALAGAALLVFVVVGARLLEAVFG